MASSFRASVSAYVRSEKARCLAVFRESTQRLIDIVQTPVASGGNLPVDTGFLRASLVAYLGDPGISITYNYNPEGKYTFDGAQVALTIANAQIGGRVSAVYTANYAVHVEFGTQFQAARGFVRLAAQRWPQIVAQVDREVQARAN